MTTTLTRTDPYTRGRWAAATWNHGDPETLYPLAKNDNERRFLDGVRDALTARHTGQVA
jgi:hypothetical protein